MSETLRQLRIGLALLQSGKPGAARDAARSILMAQPLNFDALHIAALASYHLRDLTEASSLIGRALAVRSDVVDAHVTAGLIHAAAGRAPQAVRAFHAALALNPRSKEAHYNLANCYRSMDQLEPALRHYAAALAADPRMLAAWNNQGLVLARLGRPVEAVASFTSALAIQPDFAPAHYNRGDALAAMGKPAEAIADYDRAIALNPRFAEAFCNRANARLALGQQADALADYDAALGLAPGFHQAQLSRGVLLAEMQRPDEAIESFRRVLERNPGLAAAHYNLAKVLAARGQLVEALASYDAAISLNPGHAQAHGNRGNVLRELGRLPEALASHDRAIRLDPADPDAHANRANVLTDLGRHDEALAGLRQALNLLPNDADLRTKTGQYLLLRGNFTEGLPLYEARRQRRDEPARSIATPKPMWPGGEDLDRQRILVTWEQGLGDTIQFARYVALLQRGGAEVLFAPQRQLRRLMASLPTAPAIVDDADPTLDYAFHLPLMSAMHALRTELASIPEAGPYLAAEVAAVAQWRERLQPRPGQLLVGICWQGSTSKVDRGRSFPLACFDAISRLPGVRLVSLHKGEGQSQLAALPAGMRVESLGEDFDSGPDAFIDTAAVISLCDLVITSDTAIAHLAGALGAATWVALKHVPDWRWLTDRADSPWYPTARLFRQHRPGDWTGVFADIERELRGLISSLPVQPADESSP